MRTVTSPIGTTNKRAVIQANTVARLSGATLLVGGAVAAIGYALVSFQPEQDPTTVSSLLYLVTCLLMLVGSILVVLGLPAAYRYLIERSSGALSLIGYVTTVMLLLTNNIVYTAIRALVFPIIFTDAALVARFTAAPSAIGFFLMTLLLAVIAPALLGIATVRSAGAFTRGPGILLIASSIDTLRDFVSVLNPPLPIIGNLSLVLLFLAFAWFGYALLASRPEMPIPSAQTGIAKRERAR